MKQPVKTLLKGMIFIIPLFLMTLNLNAQENEAFTKAKSEIVEMYGTFPTWFDAYPEYALSGAWENFKQISGAGSAIPPKYRELMQLAVASQIPCVYCVYYHKMAAKMFGATDEEINEAVAHGAQTRQWSMITQGSEISLEAYKKEVGAVMKYMTEKAKK